ncbi:MAG: 30S ribosomal protein S20 [Geminicoccaceae bacterium]|nr:30S ribosomal protein S20 [Geminicoccaceae bacterium]
MANHRSAEKRIRQTEKRTLQNRSRVSRIKTFIRRVEEAVEAGDRDRAREAFSAAEPEIRKGVAKGVLHLNTASRRISRLSRQVKALSVAEAGAAP